MKSIHRFLLIVFFIASAVTAFASDEHDKHAHHDTHKNEKFEPGNFIMDHIADAYDWHVFL
jgi:hypothetical protein